VSDPLDDEFDPQGDGLTPSQRAQLDALLQRLDVALASVSPELAAVARAQAEIAFYGNLHLDNNTRQYVIAQREQLRDDLEAPLATIDQGLTVMMGISEALIGRVEALSARIGEAPPGEGRSIVAQLAEAQAERLAQSRAIRAIFILIALALFFGLFAIGIAALSQPTAAAMISSISVAYGVFAGLRARGG
jgi:hypothetical protein